MPFTERLFISVVMCHNVQDVPHAETQLRSIPSVSIIIGQCSSDTALFYDLYKTSCSQGTITLLFWTREIISWRLEPTTSSFAKTKTKNQRRRTTAEQKQNASLLCRCLFALSSVLALSSSPSSVNVPLLSVTWSPLASRKVTLIIILTKSPRLEA